LWSRIRTMVLVSIVDMKAKLSTYVERAARGEQILICRHNKPVAELRPVVPRRSEPRPIGPLPGRPTFDVPDTFFEPLDSEELELWESPGTTDPLRSLQTGKVRRRVGSSVRRATRPQPRKRAASRHR
jgi:prevent-host-death family protein